MVRIGTAGWTIPRAVADRFPSEGSALERYSSCFNAAEINSSFHRPHRLSTWERWRDSVPDGFRFSAKLPKSITHARKLLDCAAELTDFLHQAQALGDKFAVALVQLPPKLEYDSARARSFFAELSAQTAAAIACEPRNLSWFSADADASLASMKVARVAADPSICEAASRPGGWLGLRYWRLHGSPMIYRSSYADRLEAYAERIDEERSRSDSWCIFDNTASSAAAGDALALQVALRSRP